MNNQRIYMDHIAGTPVAPRVMEAMLPYVQNHFGNPASIHHGGELPQEAVFRGREQVARLVGADPEEIIFTSCGTESNNLAIKGVALNGYRDRKHLVISAIEHYSVMYSAKALERFGFEVSFVPVDSRGMVDPDDIAKAMRPDTALVSIMHSNNEVGTIQPLSEISRLTRAKGIPLHTDAVPSAGRVPLDVNELGVDLLSIAANQFNGPKGVAALYLRKGTEIWPLFHGGGQEDGRRTGTENVPGIVGMGMAAQLAAESLSVRMAAYGRLEKLLRGEIQERIEGIQFNGHPEHHIPGLVNVSVRYVEGEALLLHMDMRGVSVAGASACMSVTAKASHVLEAMDALGNEALGTLLFTLGEGNTEDEVHRAVDHFRQAVDLLRMMSPLYKRG
jgi:cysteine desulfurase